MIGDLIYYDVRCASFKSADKVSPRWPYSRRKDYVNRLARLGWYRPADPSDRMLLRCFACGRERSTWTGTPQDDPGSGHAPDCRISSIWTYVWTQEYSERDYARLCIATFTEDWPYSGMSAHENLSASKMAQAGFIHHPLSESRDNVLCPYCRISLDSWDRADDPVAEHRKTRANCVHMHYLDINSKKGPNPHSKSRPIKRKLPAKKPAASRKSKPPAALQERSENPQVPTTPTVESFLKEEIIRAKNAFIKQRAKTWKDMEKEFLDSLRSLRGAPLIRGGLSQN